MTNRLLIQFFHWYYQDHQPLWQKAIQEAKHLSGLGITDVWLPPAYKGTEGADSVGYDCYDLYDLGEFDQKNSVETKYGSKKSYLDAIATLQENGMAVIADVVFNHKAGADELEKIAVRSVDYNNRNEFTSDLIEIDAWTKFTFPG
ncbi:alpha-amylase family glycosyl hydrolase, partial [Pedobacter sp.]|uniref:alpha-amylase family glycosyl hydrolase n=1 Tax=Pedobacter sp. TaxID=1411316 RepID=UPI003D7F2809